MNCGPQFAAVWSWPICWHVSAAVRRKRRIRWWGRGPCGHKNTDVSNDISITHYHLRKGEAGCLQHTASVCVTNMTMHASSYGIWAGCLGLGRSARWGLTLCLFGGNLQRYSSLQQYRSEVDWTSGSVRFVCLIAYSIEQTASHPGHIRHQLPHCRV